MDEGEWLNNEISISRSSAAVKQPTRNDSLYKYVSLSGAQSWNYLEAMLNQQKLYGATLKSLNDPYEGAPCLINDLNKDLVSEIYSDPSAEMIKRLKGEEPTTYDNIQIYEKQAKSYLHEFLARYRVMAFCNRSDSPLLWSHYADSYRGACLHFLGRSFYPKFSRSRGKLGYVSYSNHRPHLPMSLILKVLENQKGRRDRDYSINLAELEKFCFFTKGSDWSYESEIRVVYDVKNGTNYEFRADGLVAITLGPRITKEDKQKVIQIIRNSKMPYLQIIEGSLAANTFSVNAQLEG